MTNLLHSVEYALRLQTVMSDVSRIPVAPLLLWCSEIDGIRYRIIEEASRNTSMRWCLANASKSMV